MALLVWTSVRATLDCSPPCVYFGTCNSRLWPSLCVPRSVQLLIVALFLCTSVSVTLDYGPPCVYLGTCNSSLWPYLCVPRYVYLFIVALLYYSYNGNTWKYTVTRIFNFILLNIIRFVTYIIQTAYILLLNIFYTLLLVCIRPIELKIVKIIGISFVFLHANSSTECLF